MASLAYQRLAVTQWMTLWDDLIDIDLVDAGLTANVDIAIANSTTGPSYAYALSWALGNGVLTDTEIWFNPVFDHTQGTNNLLTPVYGDWGWTAMGHEIGHTLGLSHPGAYTNPPLTYNDDAEYEQDTQQYTVMSYFTADNTGADIFNSLGRSVFPQTPMIDDIFVIQSLYGADPDTRNTNTVYGFNATAGNAVFDFSVNQYPWISIYDAGGIDVLDLSGWNSTASRVSLVPGSFSDGNGLTNNISIARNTIIEAVITGDGNDHLTGNSVANYFDGGWGNDTMIGGDGGDTYIVSEAGDTVVETNANPLVGGFDWIYSMVPSYALGAHVENARILNVGTSDLYGNDLDNYLQAGLGSNLIHGGAGNDTVSYLNGVGETIGVTVSLALTTPQHTAGSGVDTLLEIENLYGSLLNDNLTGNNGNNDLLGNTGNDSLQGGGGNDTLGGAEGNDLLDGGDGIDTADYFDSNGVTVSLALTTPQDTGDANVDTLFNIENLYGGKGSDQLAGNSEANTLHGDGGDDLLQGNGGNDTLDGGPGTDNMEGGEGDDTYFVRETSDLVIEAGGGMDVVRSFLDAYTLPLLVESGIIESENFANISGNDLDNVLYAGINRNHIDGGAGNDTVNFMFAIPPDYAGTEGIHLSLFNNSETGLSGFDTVANIENIVGSLLDDDLSGSVENNKLFGEGGNDHLRGRFGDDLLDGGGGNDSLAGDASNDTLHGGFGADTLQGGDNDDLLDGGNGIDHAEYFGLRANFDITAAAEGFVLTDLNSADGAEGVDTLVDVEFILFADQVFDLSTLVPPPPPSGAVFSDFDGDGKSDIFWRNTEGGGNNAWRGGDPTQVLYLARVLDQNSKVVGLGDFDGDGKSDILWRNTSTGANIIYLSADRATTQFVPTVNNTDYKVVGVGDFNGDGKDDILWRNGKTGQNVIYRNATSTTQAVTTRADLNERVAGVGDFDGDGKADILWRNLSTGANEIWKSGNSATVQAVGDIPSQLWQVAGIGDFDGDGKDDILWRNSSNGQNSIWKSGNSATVQATAAITSQDWQVAAVGDYNGDGKADILWRNNVNGQNALWPSGNGGAAQIVRSVTSQDWRIVDGLETGDLVVGGPGNNVLYGTLGKDTIRGDLGNDTLTGSGGNDTLTGGAGADRFVFDASAHATNVDVITDFSVAQGDKLVLENSSFTALTATGALNSSMFRSGAGITTAADSNDYVIYNSTTGIVYYDADGTGATAPIALVTLTGMPALTAAMIEII